MSRTTKIGIGERIFDFFNVLITLLLALAIVVPMLNILFASISDPIEVMKHEGLFLWPRGFNLAAYQAVLKNPNIVSGYMNTIFIVVVGTSLNIVLTLIGAYVLSRKNVFWVRPLTLMIVFTMYFQGGTIPFYLTVRTVGLEGKIWALIFPVAINTFNLIVMRTAMAAVPDSLPESAMMDGASHFKILFNIMAPLTKATVAVLVLYYAVAHWNSWFNAMIFLRDKKLFPLQLILREILVQDDTTLMTAGSMAELGYVSDTIKYATIVVATAPILCIYPLLQRYFVKGVMIGAMKG
ncbi:carbohydrate ABC transporter permease [Treponema sp. OttesenSCG-928-L16]|nr:carbohydrate ABC transporter permease [Treponema sp. OttesenSCG-928-L16]